ncbi:NGG1p interacting factor 3 [Mycena floridula]|nr:NGG1p interacting factor 3 [Mycena floridula]
MATFCRNVCRAMDRIAPLKLAEKWDNVGLLLESPIPKETKRVLLTIDLTEAVYNEAVSTETSVIVSYHPTIFGALKSLTLAQPLQASLLRCAAQGISVYSPHTGLDSVWGGVNDWLVEGVISKTSATKGTVTGLTEIEGAEGKGTSGRLATFEAPITMSVLEKRIKQHLGLSQIQVAYASSERQAASVQTVAICAGSGGSVFAGKPADVYFTGEMPHHDVLAAVAKGTHVVLCGHTNTERGYLPVLANKLREDFKTEGLGDLEVIVSKKDVHPLAFV